MDNNQIIEVLQNKKSDINKLQIALFIVRYRIEYCKYYNIDMVTDPLLSKVLLFR